MTYFAFLPIELKTTRNFKVFYALLLLVVSNLQVSGWYFFINNHWASMDWSVRPKTSQPKVYQGIKAKRSSSYYYSGFSTLSVKKKSAKSPLFFRPIRYQCCFVNFLSSLSPMSHRWILAGNSASQMSR